MAGWKKNDRVSVKMRDGSLKHGFVQKNTVPGVPFKVFTDDDKSYTIPPNGVHLIAASKEPASERLAVGDRASSENNGKVFVGTVTKSDITGIKLLVDGGASYVTGPHKDFKPSNVPLPVSRPSEMDRWGVSAYKRSAALSRETDAFTATITFDGRPVFDVLNDGGGASDQYQRNRRAGANPPVNERDLFAAATAWAEEFGAQEPLFEADSAWIDWYVHDRPHGVTAEMLMDRHNKSTEQRERAEPAPGRAP